MTKKAMYCGPNWKYLNGANTNLVLNRYVSENKSRESYRLPPLIWQHPNIAKLAIFDTLLTYVFLRATLDKEFRLKTFLDGAKQAMLVISNALGAQNYEILESLVHERTLKLLKNRVSRLRPDQRQLIPIKQNNFMCVPGNISIKKRDDNKIVEIATLGLYIQGDINYVVQQKESIGFANYVFQRTYVYEESWTGGPWTVRSITHFV
ncbi:hypothetical protein ANTPLA_LOCUS10316 [Anthophora plagiata]